MLKTLQRKLKVWQKVLVIAAVIYGLCYLYKEYYTEGYNSDKAKASVATLKGKTKGTRFVLFYSDTCSHCKAMKPAWEELERVFVDDRRIIIEQINGKEQPELIKKHGVTQYPTVRFYPQGLGIPDNRVEYRGDRSKEDLQDFLTKQLERLN